MARAAEEAAAREAARAARRSERRRRYMPRAARLAGVARQLGRTVDAVQKQAQRIGAFSYPMYRSGRRKGAGEWGA